MSFRRVARSKSQKSCSSPPHQWCIWSCTPATCSARAPSTRSSATGTRTASTPATARTSRSSWAAGSAAASSSARPSARCGCPTSRSSEIGAATERARDLGRRRPARGPRGPGGLAQRRRHAGRRRDRLLAGASDEAPAQAPVACGLSPAARAASLRGGVASRKTCHTVGMRSRSSRSISLEARSISSALRPSARSTRAATSRRSGARRHGQQLEHAVDARMGLDDLGDRLALLGRRRLADEQVLGIATEGHGDDRQQHADGDRGQAVVDLVAGGLEQRDAREGQDDADDRAPSPRRGPSWSSDRGWRARSSRTAVAARWPRGASGAMRARATRRPPAGRSRGRRRRCRTSRAPRAGRRSGAGPRRARSRRPRRRSRRPPGRPRRSAPCRGRTGARRRAGAPPAPARRAGRPGSSCRRSSGPPRPAWPRSPRRRRRRAWPPRSTRWPPAR